MAINGITDIAATVTVSKSEYEELIRESNTLRIIENIVAKRDGNISTNLLKDILGMYMDELEDIEDGSK